LQPWPIAAGIAQGTDPRTPQKRMRIQASPYGFVSGTRLTTV
jgi:hypothetical protein